jgi:ATP-dependent RNA helicase RhlE
MAFKALGLKDQITRALAEEGYETPTPIQAKAIPPILEGRDILATAQTGTGKTAAFALPVIHRLTDTPIDKTRRGPVLPRVLVLSPTRELAAQIGESFKTYGRNSHLRGAVVFGGVSQFHQVRTIRQGIDILVAAPGRLVDLMDQGLIDLSAIEIFILDEADRMLDMGFIKPIQYIASKLSKKRQTLLFSATMPREIVHLAESLLSDPVRVAAAPAGTPAARIEESLYMISFRDKQTLLNHMLQQEGVNRAVVFTKTKHGADKVGKRLDEAGVNNVVIHGNKAQNFRTRALDAFRAGRAKVLVATDVAARGLDVDGITHVFNYDLPMEPEAYVHRIGRTARAGAAGIAIAFCDPSERDLLRQVEKLIGRKIPRIEDFPDIPRTEIPEHHQRPPHHHSSRPPHSGNAGSPPHAHHHAGPRQDGPARGDGQSRPFGNKPKKGPRAQSRGDSPTGGGKPSYGGGKPGYGGGGGGKPGGGAKRSFGPRKGKR